MKSRKGLNIFFAVFLIIPAAAFLPKLFLKDTILYRSVLTEQVILYIGSPVKLLFLLLSFVYSMRCVKFFQRDNPVRPAWIFMTLGLLGYLLGQSVLAVYQLILPVATPFPSAGDIFFLAGTVFLILALSCFIRAYKEAGYPLGGKKEIILINGFLLVFFVFLGYMVLTPLLRAPDQPLKLFFNLAYPVLDFIMLIPALMLVMVVQKLRGGALVNVWAFIAGGFICFAVGDVLFAYFDLMDKTALDPVLDLMYVFGYILIARGVIFQYDLAS